MIQECSARGFTGVVCDFEAGRLPPLEQVVRGAGQPVPPPELDPHRAGAVRPLLPPTPWS